MNNEQTEQTEQTVEVQEPTGQDHKCRRCGRKQGLVSKYNIWLCRQCFRELAKTVGFKKYS
mgnify:CR=1 FL=1|tara:strand:- start:278 stop:460 length:183 start_codon:yes stop_codon:yes gene_type:complete